MAITQAATASAMCNDPLARPLRFGDIEQIEAIRKLPPLDVPRRDEPDAKLRTWRVTVRFNGFKEYEVDAADRDEAEGIALGLAETDDPMEWEIDENDVEVELLDDH